MAVVVTVGTVNAFGGENARTPAPPGEPVQVRLTGADMYQTSVDGGRTWGRPLPQARQIWLRSRVFDPVAAPADADRAPGALRAAAAGGAYLVQFRAVPLDSQRQQVRGLGARIGGYLPDFAYVVRMNPATRAKVAALPFVRWVGAYHPGDKVEPEALAATGAQRYVITLVERDAADARAVLDRIGALGATGVVTSVRVVEATLDSGQLRAVAGLDAVLAVDRWFAPETDMDKARIQSGANFVETAGGYRGQGVRGEVMDGGVRLTHQEFRAHPPVVVSNSTNIGHGSSTYGQIFASGVNATARGMLPEGQGIFALNSTANRAAHTQALVDPNGPFRAVFQSNSWGSGLTTNYTATSAQMDDIVFDSDLLICQSQSNDGTRNSRPQAWAKNVLSVGGIRHRDTLSRDDDAWAGGASIGPATDGRIKPDVSNYYDRIFTTSSASDTAYTPNFGGTSGATPITCGTAGLMFQMWADGVFAGAPGQHRDVFASRPHAATAKALLINTANQYPFTGAAADLTRVHQGWGTPSVQNMYQRAQTGGFRLPVLVNETDLVTVGTRRTYQVTTRAGGLPLRATMVYTDPMGSPSAARARVNDLSLKVTAPNGTVFWGNNGLLAGNWSTPGGVSNKVDTVENVFVQQPAAGTWTVEVIADEVNVDAHVETAATDADFALVVSTGA
ncbi:MAG: peptidase S8 [Actinobacteria bacterium 13_2_20CM_2_71_6]|nr:MAG: peptidase S8 [Actinobacteria bacterium 13_2_20CM_2_71_6]